MNCKKCGNEIMENEKFCTKCGTKANNDNQGNKKELERKSNRKSLLERLKILLKGRKTMLIAFLLVLVIIAILSIIAVIVFNNNKIIPTDIQQEDNIEENTMADQETEQQKYSKEQIINLLTSEKDKNGMIGIIRFAELRLRNELNALDESTTYLFKYDYKIVNNDTINFYIVVPEPIYGEYTYYVWSYQASYTIMEDTIQYITDFINGKAVNDIKVNELFKINKEIKLGFADHVPSDTLSSYVSQAMYKAESILDYDPTKTETEVAEESKEKLINKIKSEIEAENKYRETNFQPTEEQMEHALKHFGYKIENFNTLNYGTYIAEQCWFAINPKTGTYYKEPINTDESSNNSNVTSNNSSGTSNNNQIINSQPKQESNVKNIEMPNLIGLTRTQAENKLNELGISFTVEKTNSISKDTVFSQSVPAGTSKTVNEFGTIIIKTYQKVSALVRVTVKNADSSKKYELVGKNVKVVLNGQTNEDSYFNGESTSRNFSNINTPNITVQVYIDNELVKSQEFNIEELVQKSDYYTDVTINI